MSSPEGGRKVAIAFGTRPEAIKLVRVIATLEELGAPPFVISTGQHISMLKQALDFFEVTVHHDLGLMQEGTSLPSLLSRVVGQIDQVLARENPTLLVTQGDTMTTLGATLAAYYRQIPVAHVEAGLRSFDDQNPFPEEGNRVLISRLARWHFCPTERARENLVREGVSPDRIWVTGNTVIDALAWARHKLRQQASAGGAAAAPPELADIPPEALDRFILVTAHRRENFGQGLASICAAIRAILAKREDLHMVWPVHLNPMVRDAVAMNLEGCPRVYCIPPVDYPSLLYLLDRCHFVLTDSGGIQEEALVFHKPVLIMRRVTERPEIVEAGGAWVVGTSPERICSAADRLLEEKDLYQTMAGAANPFGDGRASERIAAVLLV
jgi:UDP-N-acetylglucosamine 2-epimerase (non-hydrolysing)